MLKTVFSHLIVYGLIITTSWTLQAQTGEDTAKPKIPKSLENLRDMALNGKLFDKKEYPVVRKACSELFEERSSNKIKEAFGSDFDAIDAFLKKNVEFREELLTAFDDKQDDITAGLKIIHEIWKQKPDNLIKYSNLAIAISVVWDQPENLYDYRPHQVRTHSTLPVNYGGIKPLDLFNYLIEKEKEIKGREPFSRLSNLPWEFLVYCVNDTTPFNERDWALKSYLTKRYGIGRIYSDIQYDTEMLRTESKVCKLDGKPYTLDSILKHGGVCAMQADFASRVGKSLMVPAAYVGGESAQLGLHAWVMWVEIRSVTKQKIDFALMDHGRYLGDNYYTGNLKDPQTGEKILDRDMERRLFAVGQDRQGKRQSDLAMDVYHDIVQQLNLPANRQIRYLDACLKLCDYNEMAWIELAGKVKSREIDMEYKPAILQRVNTILKSFEKYPDFTFRVANDLLEIQDNTSSKIQFYEKLIAIYEKAARPDLVCEARMNWAKMLSDEKKPQVAAKGLAQTILKYPAEGRYIPKLLIELKEIGEKFKDGDKIVNQCYQDLIPRVPARRGTDPSEYAIKFYQDAIEHFKDQKGKEKIVKDLENRLAALVPKRS